jgi:hypothetical protein
LSVEVAKIRSERIAQIGPPAAGRGLGPRGLRGGPPYRDRFGPPDFRRPGREDRERPRRGGPPPLEEAAGVQSAERPAAEAPI